jgi:subtilase family serine protease
VNVCGGQRRSCRASGHSYALPSIVSEAATFSSQYGLPQLDGQGGDPTLTVLQPEGTAAANKGWAVEIALDVEWVHAAAPQANILLVQTVNSGTINLLNGDYYASQTAGVVAVTNSWGQGAFGGESYYDYYLNGWSYNYTSGNNVAITFASGDSGANGEWPAYSPYVVAAGGTSLTVQSGGGYGSETGWSGSGGGLSTYGYNPSGYVYGTYHSRYYGYLEYAPAYQWGETVNGFTGTNGQYGPRTIPDVSMVADPNTGVAVYSSYGLSGWAQVGGTSLASPLIAGVIALADQQRIASGLGTLTAYGANTDLYATFVSGSYGGYANSFHDVTSGNNGYPAGRGYDLVTGLGTPQVPAIVNTVLQN